MKMAAKLKIKILEVLILQCLDIAKSTCISHIVDKCTWFGRHNYSINGIRNTRTPRAKGYLI